jgi:eukaryotic-like serine/threonine-protein kinase
MTGAPEESAAALPEIGEVLASKYRLERCIGRGGMGAVFQARHEILNQLVAIKLLLPEVAADAAAVTRFLNEAKASAQIRNDHVAKVLDVDTLPSGSAFMVLEFLEGADIATLLSRQGAFALAEAAGFVLQALEAIAQAHALGIVHRDLKPANLFLAHRPDGTSIIKVLDFGISKASAAQDSGLTGDHAMLGSPCFMSPEQVKSSKNVDVRADIWSIGVCLYQMLTNQLPFWNENVGAVYALIFEANPPKVSGLDASLPPALDAILARCLSRDLEKRYQNAAELAEALAPFANESERGAVERIRRILGLPAAPAPAPAPTPAPAPAPVAAEPVAPPTARPPASEVVDQDEETRQPFNSPFTNEPQDIHEEATYKPFTSPFAQARSADPLVCEEEPNATTPGLPAFVLGEDEVTVKGSPHLSSQSSRSSSEAATVEAVAAPSRMFGPVWIGLGLLGVALLAAAGYFVFLR